MEGIEKEVEELASKLAEKYRGHGSHDATVKQYKELAAFIIAEGYRHPLQSGEKYKANFCFGQNNPFDDLMYEFANAETEEYREEIYKEIKAMQSGEKLSISTKTVLGSEIFNALNIPLTLTEIDTLLRILAKFGHSGQADK